MARQPRREPPVIVRVSYVVDPEAADRVLDLIVQGLQEAAAEKDMRDAQHQQSNAG